jgi:hypothetical protein
MKFLLRKCWAFTIIIGCYVVPIDGRDSCPIISVTMGKIRVDPPSICTFVLEGTNVTRTGMTSVLGGYWYGLIYYTCDECTGTLPSIISGCIGCFACYHDTLLTRCEGNDGPKLVIGICIGMVVTLILTLIYWKWSKWFNRVLIKQYICCKWMQDHRSKKKLNNHIKLERRIKQQLELQALTPLPAQALTLPELLS